jgi:hypothetical protein
MIWPVIIKKGPELNQTLATIKFDQYGKKNNQEIFICDEWTTGFEWANHHGYNQALFVKSGTVIQDWIKWQQLIDNYPHKGLIAHLIWKSGQPLYLDDQCWFMDIDQFDKDDFTVAEVSHPEPVRSPQNLHDDYTPLWVKPGTGVIQYATTNFGQGLIARQLSNNDPIVNWNNAARDLKSYMYNGTLDLLNFQGYKDLAENQLWIFNNEPIVLIKKPSLISPGSGLSWMLNIIESDTARMQIVDISKVQIKFCKKLWTTWDGMDYGTFVWNFIDKNQLVHYELDNPKLTRLERLQLKSKTRFINYVNSKFNTLVPENFSLQWQLARQTKQINFANTSLITWVLENDTTNYDHIWCSNILDYKWTLLHTTTDQYELFQSKLQ